MNQRKPTPFDLLEPDVLDTVKQMLLTGAAYRDVQDFLAKQKISIEINDIDAFSASLNADVAALRSAQDTLQSMLLEVDRQPDLDASDALLRLASQHLLRILSHTDEKKWSEMEIDKLLSATVGLVNAAVYKKRADYTIQKTSKTGIDAIKKTVFRALAKECPELYKELSAFLDQKKATIQGTD